MLAKIFVALLTVVGLVSYLQGETQTYLVKRAEHFPQDRFVEKWSPLEHRLFVNTGKKTIEEAGGQPFRVTSYQINYNGKYALMNITPKDEDEKWHYDSMESKGYIVLLSTMEVVTSFDPQLGGPRTDAVFFSLAELPTDYYNVEPSTGT